MGGDCFPPPCTLVVVLQRAVASGCPRGAYRNLPRLSECVWQVSLLAVSGFSQFVLAVPGGVPRRGCSKAFAGEAAVTPRQAPSGKPYDLCSQLTTLRSGLCTFLEWLKVRYKCFQRFVVTWSSSVYLRYECLVHCIITYCGSIGDESPSVCSAWKGGSGYSCWHSSQCSRFSPFIHVKTSVEYCW